MTLNICWVVLLIWSKLRRSHLNLLMCLWSAGILAGANWFMVASFANLVELAVRWGSEGVWAVSVLSQSRLVWGLGRASWWLTGPLESKWKPFEAWVCNWHSFIPPASIDQSSLMASQDSRRGELDSIFWWQELQSHIFKQHIYRKGK